MRIRLLPPDSPLGWTPYAWLVYLSFFIVSAVVTSDTAGEWTMNAAGLVVFLGLYFRAFWVSGGALLRMAFGVVGLGVVLAPYNPGASAFFIYGAAFLGDAVKPGAAVRWMLLIGGTNIHFGEVRRKDAALLAAQRDAQRLAALAERERIARDLHDLLGHTLSVIVH